jgi:hypothetical protein
MEKLYWHSIVPKVAVYVCTRIPPRCEYLILLKNIVLILDFKVQNTDRV